MKKQLALLLLLMLCLLPGWAVASENTTMRYPDDFTDGKYVQSSGISTFTRSMTFGDYLERGNVNLADKERLHYEAPKGLKILSEKKEDGRITLTIDLKNSDWGTLLLYANPYPKVNFRYSLDCPDPDKYETHTGFSGWFADKTVSYVTGLMDDGIHWDSNNLQQSNGETVGEIVASQSLIKPRQSGTSMNYVAWLDKEDPDHRYYEYFEIVYNIVDTEPFTIPFRYITKASLDATRNASMPSGVSVKSTADGDITFLTSASVRDADVPVVLNAPDGAAYMRITQPENLARQYDVTDGTARFTRQLHDGSATHEEQITLAWYSSSGTQLGYGTFMLHAEPADYMPWPNYNPNDWSAVPASRLEWDNNAAGAGVTVAYNASIGELHIDYNDKATITGNVGDIPVRVKAPADATCYRINHSGGNNIMGRDDNASKTQIDFTSEQPLIPIERDENGDAWIEITAIVPVQVINLGALEVYLQTGEGDAWPYSGGITTIFWYTSEAQANQNDGKSPQYKEFVADTMGALCVTNRVPVVNAETDIQEPVQEVTCVGSDAYKRGWRLVVRRYPHKGSDAFHYELTLENEYGVYQPLTQNMVFYMPYPKDFNSHSGYTYGLRHYDSEYSKFDLVDVKLTEFGVRFEISSLSPFVLEWEDPNNPTPDNPGGGDDGGDDSGDTPTPGGSTGRYHLYNLDMQPGHLLTMENVRVKHVNAFYLGKSTVKGGYIDRLFIAYTDEQMNDLPKDGLVLNGTEINTLEFSLSTGAATPSFSQPFIHLTKGTTINTLLVDSKLPPLSTWLTYDSSVTINKVEFNTPNGTQTMDFAEFLAMQGGN